MRTMTVLNKLLAAQGLWMRDLQVDLEEQILSIQVQPRWHISRCGTCGRKIHQRHDRAGRAWRHLDVFGVRTYLRYAIWRVRCRRCGVRTEAVPWATVGSRFTHAFEHQVASLVQYCDLSAVAAHYHLAWSSVRRIVRRVVAEGWDSEASLEGLRVIGIDEISYRKRHKYLTVVVDPIGGRAVWAGKDRKVKTLLRFFRKLGPKRSAQLEAVTADMWEPYQQVLRKKAPQARVIFDRFHIVRHLNKAVSRVRQQLIREGDAQTRKDLKNTRFPMLKRPSSRTPRGRQVLKEQMRSNRRLYRAMLLKDHLMDLYRYQREGWAKRFLEGWLHRAMASKWSRSRRSPR